MYRGVGEMSFLFRKQEDDHQLSRAAERLIAGVRQGLSEAEAAAQAEVSVEEHRQWQRDRVFRAALRKARRAGPYKPWVNLHEVLEEMKAAGEGPGSESWERETGGDPRAEAATIVTHKKYGAQPEQVPTKRYE
jgi:hypothetical protein